MTASSLPYRAMHDGAGPKQSRRDVIQALLRTVKSTQWEGSRTVMGSFYSRLQAMAVKRQTAIILLANIMLVLVVTLLHDFRGYYFYLNGSEHDTLLTFLALLLAFRASQAYNRGELGL